VILSRQVSVSGFAINRFDRNGIVVRTPDSTAEPSSVFVTRNFIGTDPVGISARPNGGAGVVLSGVGAVLGGDVDAQRNIISGNRGPGVWITRGAAPPESLASAPQVVGNRIGTSFYTGVVLPNGAEGVLVEADFASITDNRISGNGSSGVRVAGGAGGPSGVSLARNWIGVEGRNGSSPSAPFGDGVTASGAALSLSGDLVYGNSGAGVSVTGGSLSIDGAEIGAVLSGDPPAGNGGTGVLAKDATSVDIRHTVIVANGGDGVRLFGVVATAAAPSILTANWIGVAKYGAPLGNAGDGIRLVGCRHVFVGRVTARAEGGGPPTTSPNYIGSNTGYGLRIEPPAGAVNPPDDEPDIVVDLNLIGSYAADGTLFGTVAVPNRLGGIRIAGVGGVGVTRNVIANNGGDGIVLGDRLESGAARPSSGNLIQYNGIGVNKLNPPFDANGNDGNGINIVFGSNNRILDNAITFNRFAGVSIVSGTGNLMSRNSIHDNRRLDISLATMGREINDLLDPDEGPNGLQNAPVLSPPWYWDGYGLAAPYFFNSLPGRTFQIEFFSGGVYVKSVRVTTDEDGNASGVARLELGRGAAVTATATDLSTNNTSPLARAAVPTVTPVVGGSFFYNNSAFDGHDPSANAADDNAIAPGKYPLISLARVPWDRFPPNYTTYDKGINGIMIDVARAPAGDPPSVNDFEFVVDDTVRQGGVTRSRPAPAPSAFTVRPGAGVGGSDRVTITWPDRSIRNAWLRVRYLRAEPAGRVTLVFGNLAGNVAGSGYPPVRYDYARVDAMDLAAIRSRLTGATADLTSRYDLNRDGRVDLLDFAVVRSNLGAVLQMDWFQGP
jgi:parallel beta-helix repeat protein